MFFVAKKGNLGNNGILMLLLSSFIQGGSGVWLKITGFSLQVFPGIFLRFVMAVFLTLVFIYFKKVKINKFYLGNIKALTVLIISFILANIFYTYSVLYTKVALSNFSFYSGSFISSFVIGWLFLKEKPTFSKIISLFLSLIGVYLFAGKGFLLDYGVLFGLISGSIIPITNFYRGSLGNKINALLVVLLPYVGVLFSSFLISVILHQNIVAVVATPSWQMYLGSFLYAFVLVFGNILVIYGLKSTEIYLASVVLSTNMLFSAVYGFFMLNETLLANELIGGLFIVLAIITPSLFKAKNKLLIFNFYKKPKIATVPVQRF